MRSGTLKAINRNRGMAAILTEDDAYTIIELLSDDDFEVGDEMDWEDDYGMGSSRYRNVTKGIACEVYVQSHGVHHTQLRQQLLF